MGFSDFLKNVSKVVETANEVLNTVNSVNNIDQWFNQMIAELDNPSSKSQALVEIAYYIGTLNNDDWNYVQSHLGVKVLRNPRATYLSNYCQHVVRLEANQFKNMLGYSIPDAIDTIRYNINNMDIHDLAGYFGLFKAYAERDPKANTIYNNMRQLLLNS